MDDNSEIILEEVFSQSSYNSDNNIDTALCHNLINFNNQNTEHTHPDHTHGNHTHADHLCIDHTHADHPCIDDTHADHTHLLDCLPTISDSNTITVSLNSDLELNLKKIFKLLQYINIILIQSCNSYKDKYFREFTKIKLTNLFTLVNENYSPIYSHIISPLTEQTEIDNILTSLVYTDLLEYSIQNYIELLRRIEYFIFQLKKNLMNFS